MSYGLVSGLRWGREIDWNFYAKRYFEIGEGISTDNYEPLFYGICYLFYNTGISYWCFIFIQCLFLMYSICLLFKNYKRECMFMFLLLPFLIRSNENFIRWYFAFSFVLIAFYFYTKKKPLATICMLCCASLTHIGTLIMIPFFLFGNFLAKKLVNERYLLLLMSVVFFASVSQLDMIVSLSHFALSLGLGEIDPRMNQYLEATELIVSGDFGELGIADRSFSNQARYFIAYFPIIYFAPKYLNKYKYGYYFYNLTAIGVILDPIFSLVEILGRFSGAFLFFSSIVGGLTYYNIFKNQQTTIMLRLLCLFSIFCSIWPFISYALSREGFYDMTYIWDSNGRDYLPVE